jgi:hypothetical protein
LFGVHHFFGSFASHLGSLHADGRHSVCLHAGHWGTAGTQSEQQQEKPPQSSLQVQQAACVSVAWCALDGSELP